MNQTFNKLIDDALILLLNKPSLNIFGSLFYTLDKEIREVNEIFDKDIPITCNCDGKKISYVKSQLRDINIYKFLFYTIHQLLHILSFHNVRKGNREEKLWNVCADHIVNTICKEIPILEIPEGEVFLEYIYQEFPNITTEQLYEMLKDDNNISINSNKKTLQDDKQDENKESDKDNESSKNNKKDDKEEQDKNKESNEKDDKTNKKKDINIITVHDKKDNKSYKFISDIEVNMDNIKEIEENTEEFNQNAQILWNTFLDKGDLPGDLIDYLNKILKVEIPWTEVLENSLLYPVQKIGRRSWRQPNIYFKNYFRSMGTVKSDNDYKTIIACVDCSMSISTDDLNKFSGVLLGSVEHFKKIIIFVHDVNITEEIEIDSPTETTLYDRIKEYKGRGGTSHEAVFNRISEIIEDEDISTILFLTDFYSDVQSIYSKYNWLKEYETIWILNSDRKIELSDIQIRTIYIK